MLVKIYIGYFVATRQRTNFWIYSLLSLLQKFRACKAIHNKIRSKSEVFERIFSQDFYFKILFSAYLNNRLISGHRPFFLKDFPQRFLAKQPRKIHGTHGGHGERFCLKIILKILIHKQRRAEIPMVSLAQDNTLRNGTFFCQVFLLKIIFSTTQM